MVGAAVTTLLYLLLFGTFSATAGVGGSGGQTRGRHPHHGGVARKGPVP